MTSTGPRGPNIIHTGPDTSRTQQMTFTDKQAKRLTDAGFTIVNLRFKRLARSETTILAINVNQRCWISEDDNGRIEYNHGERSLRGPNDDNDMFVYGPVMSVWDHGWKPGKYEAASKYAAETAIRAK